MNITFTVVGEFSDSLDDGDIQNIRCDLEDTIRIEWGGKMVVVEVARA